MLKKFAKNIYIADGPMVKFFGFNFPTRMTVVVLPNRKLFVHSPVPIEPIKKEVQKLGEVTYLISPNKLHYLFLPEWQKAFPQAITYGTPEFKENKKGIKIDRIIEKRADLPWKESLNTFLIDTPFMQEAIFFHKESRTLIVADLIENFDPNSLSPLTKILGKLTGVLAPTGKTPIDWRVSFYFNKNYNRQIIQKIINLTPEKIILSHGKLITYNVTAFLEKSFGWILR